MVTATVASSVQLVVFVLSIPYSVISISLFVHHRKRPALRSRYPGLSLLSSIGKPLPANHQRLAPSCSSTLSRAWSSSESPTKRNRECHCWPACSKRRKSTCCGSWCTGPSSCAPTASSKLSASSNASHAPRMWSAASATPVSRSSSGL